MKDMESLREDHHLAVALEIDRVASQDPYFQSRHLFVNADLFLSFAYKAMCVIPSPSRRSVLICLCILFFSFDQC